MSTVKDSATFFQHGNSAQFEYVLALYPQALKLKAEKRGIGKKSEKLIRLDDWYQNELPKVIKKRGKDAHLLHEELVQTMEWKQTRGKFYPQLSYLIKVNTPRAVVMETKKAFRKLPNLEQALNALSNLKGVGITMASALLAAALPETAPFMADECLMAIPDIEGIDYTAKEYLKFVAHIQQTADRLNQEVQGTTETANGDATGTEAVVTVENGDTEPKPKKWSAHSVELALWTHYVASDLLPEMLTGMPASNGVLSAPLKGDIQETDSIATSDGNDDTNTTTTATNGISNEEHDEDVDDDDNSQNAMESEESNPATENNKLITNGKAPEELVDSAIVPAKVDGTNDTQQQDPEEANKISIDGPTAEPAVAEPSDLSTITATTRTDATASIVSNNSSSTTTSTVEKPFVAESLDDCTKSGDSLDEPLPVEAAAAAVATLCTTDEAADSDSQSSNSNKRPLYCDDNSEDKPELSAPKLIKL